MKYISIILITFSISVHAQSLKAKIEYSMMIAGDPMFGKLLIDETKSVFSWGALAKSISKTEKKDIAGNPGMLITLTDTSKTYVFADFNSDEMIERRSDSPSDILEKIPSFEWTILEDTKQIKNYACQKATTKFRGRVYTLWFTPDIPINIGPWKFSGLPGLILEIEDEDHYALFSASNIEIPHKSIVRIPTERPRISREQYLKKRKENDLKEKKRVESMYSDKEGNMVLDIAYIGLEKDQ